MQKKLQKQYYRLATYFLILFLTVGFNPPIFCQKSVGQYKKLADDAIRPYFSNEIFRKINCLTYMIRGKTGIDQSGGGFSGNEAVILNSPSCVMIDYTLFSDDLKWTFYFYIIVDSNFIVSCDSIHANSPPYEEIRNIPDCVRLGRKCNFISKEEAISIARRDLIEYPENLLVTFARPAQALDFFWIVHGADKRVADFSKPAPETGWNTFNKKKDTRYVSAVSGKILSFEEYQLLDNW